MVDYYDKPEDFAGERVIVVGGGRSGDWAATELHEGGKQVLEVDHVVKEIGGAVDYSIFQGFPPLQLYEKYDNYRFQLHQVVMQPHSCESVDVPNLYLGGYLAAGLGLVVIAMHGTTYAIAGDILQKEGQL